MSFMTIGTMTVSPSIMMDLNLFAMQGKDAETSPSESVGSIVSTSQDMLPRYLPTTSRSLSSTPRRSRRLQPMTSLAKPILTSTSTSPSSSSVTPAPTTSASATVGDRKASTVSRHRASRGTAAPRKHRLMVAKGSNAFKTETVSLADGSQIEMITLDMRDYTIKMTKKPWGRVGKASSEKATGSKCD